LEEQREKSMKANSEQASANMNARRAELAAARGQLDRSRAYSEGLTILSKLEGLLAEHSATLKQLKQRASRLEETARRFIEREAVYFEGDLTAIAKQLISSGGNVTQVITAARLPLEKSIYASLKLPESGDLESVKEIDFERAAVDALQQAIHLQKKNIAASRREVIGELSRSLDNARATIARQLLAGLKTLNSLADQDRALAQQLNQAELEFFKPRPFPANILSTQATEWFLECVSQGLIDSAEMTESGWTKAS
jgi:hypothetical protein